MSLAEQPPTAQRSVEPRLGVEPAPHKIGLIALSSDMVTERDFSLMLPACGEVMYYTSRVLLTLPVTVENLRRMGAKIQVQPDGFDIPGRQRFSGAELDSFGDHRVAMAFAVAALSAKQECRLRNSEAATVSFPEFFDQLEKVAER